jgi:lipoyl(octanoyl) transferase
VVQTVFFRDLGLIPYKEAWDYQDALFQETVEAKRLNYNLPEGENHLTKDYLLFCEHPNVITMGKSGDESHLLLDEAARDDKHIDYFRINRGGDITCHGPGQIVGYPILDLDHFFTDIHKYLRLLEEMVILTLAEYGIKGERLPGATGVWLDANIPGRARKICAMGIRCSRWVTMHGFAININNDLSYFDYIVPCGITDKGVTSLEREFGRKVDMQEVKDKLKRHFSTLFNVQLAAQVAQDL